ncbi:MAG TPA: single-stranded-DNA-specific exonuclease RecJ, partial [Pirellulales bacterium]|nr:single-stranded-DNA-specific exonuclease RecJ [Pirellulales bacterium]
MAKLWRIQSHDSDRILSIERSLGVSAVVAQLLVCRGLLDAQVARDFLDARLGTLRDPEDLPGCSAAAERVMAAVKDGRRIVIYGDYDVDGMTGTAILYLCLKMLAAEVSYYVPHRVDEGYGLNADALRSLAERGAQVVVTVDCGVTSVAEAELARQLGLELVITDHHAIADRLPAAAAIVHPALPGSVYPFTGLCGAGVAFKLAWALCQRASDSKKVAPRMRDFLLHAVALAALGTVADVVPLVDENRVLVRRGLTSLRQQPGLGLAALMKLTSLDAKAELSSEDIAFMLAPRLNAVGRLGQATLGVELLVTDVADRARALAAYLHELNGSRDSLERSIYLAANKQACEQFDPEGDAALVLADRGWHPGVIGIVAGRLAEKFHRPVILVAFDPLGVKPGAGSARSVPGFNLSAALATCAEHLLAHGGHAAAAGLKIEEHKLADFRAQFCEHAASELSSSARALELRIDAEVPFSALSTVAVEQIEKLSPFGHSNPRPMLCASNVTLCEPPKRIGGGGRHLSLWLTQHGVRLRAVAFGGGAWETPLAEIGGPIAVAFRPIINQFR